MSSLDIAHFREVLGHFVTGVVVVTGATSEGPSGFTCQTFGALSLEPTLISFSARTESNSWPKVREAMTVGVNILAADQEALARVFATSGADKFAGVAWSPGPNGAPLLGGALAHLEGRIVYVSAQGDHDIVVVGVDYVQSHSGSPLVFYRGGFSALD
jgi:3-hydroxy-9,10-secoandrosta-1,3,5(10)-triene-9,17-dione monooxygenase reductase component